MRGNYVNHSGELVRLRSWLLSEVYRLQALRSGGDTSKLDTAYDALRDEDRRREYNGRHAGGSRGGGAASARRDTSESFEVVERGSGELKDWAPAGRQAGGGAADTPELSLGKMAGVLNEAVTGGRLCAPNSLSCFGAGLCLCFASLTCFKCFCWSSARDCMISTTGAARLAVLTLMAQP